jgi:hypothetical protein
MAAREAVSVLRPIDVPDGPVQVLPAPEELGEAGIRFVILKAGSTPVTEIS